MPEPTFAPRTSNSETAEAATMTRFKDWLVEHALSGTTNEPTMQQFLESQTISPEDWKKRVATQTEVYLAHRSFPKVFKSQEKGLEGHAVSYLMVPGYKNHPDDKSRGLVVLQPGALNSREVLATLSCMLGALGYDTMLVAHTRNQASWGHSESSEVSGVKKVVQTVSDFVHGGDSANTAARNFVNVVSSEIGYDAKSGQYTAAGRITAGAIESELMKNSGRWDNVCLAGVSNGAAVMLRSAEALVDKGLSEKLHLHLLSPGGFTNTEKLPFMQRISAMVKLLGKFLAEDKSVKAQMGEQQALLEGSAAAGFTPDNNALLSTLAEIETLYELTAPVFAEVINKIKDKLSLRIGSGQKDILFPPGAVAHTLTVAGLAAEDSQYTVDGPHAWPVYFPLDAMIEIHNQLQRV